MRAESPQRIGGGEKLARTLLQNSGFVGGESDGNLRSVLGRTFRAMRSGGRACDWAGWLEKRVG